MSDTVTIADIYKLFERTEAQFAEFQQEAERRSAEAERRNAEAKAEADRRNAEADRRREEANRTMEELKKQVRETTEAVNRLTTPLCFFIEEMVEPAVVRLFQERRIDVTQTMSRLKSQRPGAAMEIDIVAVNGSELVAVECKSRLSKDDVDDFVNRLQRFKVAFPQFREFQVYGAVAGIEIDQGIDAYAYRQGLFVIKQSGETVKIVNNNQFQPVGFA
jgi:DNA repair exonuclease SbcCD ATPase subunit